MSYVLGFKDRALVHFFENEPTIYDKYSIAENIYLDILDDRKEDNKAFYRKILKRKDAKSKLDIFKKYVEVNWVQDSFYQHTFESNCKMTPKEKADFLRLYGLEFGSLDFFRYFKYTSVFDTTNQLFNSKKEARRYADSMKNRIKRNSIFQSFYPFAFLISDFDDDMDIDTFFDGLEPILVWKDCVICGQGFQSERRGEVCSKKCRNKLRTVK